MKRVLVPVFLVLTALILTACTQPVLGDTLRSDKPRVTDPVLLGKSDTAALVEGNSTFAFNLYQQLKSSEGNLLYSPYSVSIALAMTYAGARGETEKQMAGTMKYLLAQNNLHPAFNDMDIKLASRGQGAKGKDGQPFRLKIANAIWGQRDFKFLPGFLDTLAENYGAGLRIVDFEKSPEDSRITINKWVSDQTEQKIKDLIPQGVIDELTRLVLTNAVYFNGAWLYPFSDKSTDDGQFNLLDGKTVTIPMMHQTESFAYTEGDNYQAVELPYDGNELSMIILLPKGGQFAAFEGSLSYEKVNPIINDLEKKNVTLSMPKFKFESKFSLKDSLSQMGMPVAFSDDADFSGMTGNRDLTIADVVHKAFIAVDEAGTEAAAASAVIMRLTSAPAEPVEFTMDRPFIFLIRDVETGSILFAGRVVDPAA